MFLGEYNLKFTSIGRVILPKKIRSEISGTTIILSKGFEGCIWGYSEEGFEKLAKIQLEISATEERARLIRRYLFGGSIPVELDKQSRFVIPANLLKYANLESEVVIIGTGDHFEIWQEATWKDHLAKIEEEYARIS
jgi:MraZ protein